MIKHSDTVKEIFTALAKAQGDIENPKKGNVNPHFGYKYADLSSIRDVSRKPLADNGLAVIQSPLITSDNVLELETVISHCSGEWISSILALKLGRGDPQSIGSIITYAKRYALSAMLGIAPEGEDDDAGKINADMIPPKTKVKIPTSQDVNSQTKEQKELFSNLIKKLSLSKEGFAEIVKQVLNGKVIEKSSELKKDEMEIILLEFKRLIEEREKVSNLEEVKKDNSDNDNLKESEQIKDSGKVENINEVNETNNKEDKQNET
jgi:hypothetical protein